MGACDVQPLDGGVECKDGWMGWRIWRWTGWISRWRDGWMDEQYNIYMDKWSDGGMIRDGESLDGGMNGWVDGGMDGWMVELHQYG